MSDTLSLFAADDAATSAIGRSVADALRPGDLVLLQGDLGAGKTALARAIIRGLAADEKLEVPSPTFLLVLPYTAGATQVLHADLYRLAEAGEIEELGLFDDDRAIVLVEWPDRAPDLSERADIIVRLSIPTGGEGRNLELALPHHPDRQHEMASACATFRV